MSMKKLCLFFSISLFLTSCATPSKPPATTVIGGVEISIDTLKSKLGMQRDITDLGFEEESFDTCDFGIDQEPSCKTNYLNIIHFRLQCRDSVGTVDSVTNIELIPVQSHHIRWKVGYFAGSTNTDSEGYGKVEFVSPGSSKSQRLSFRINQNSLGVTASEVSRIIVPKDWCE